MPTRGKAPHDRRRQWESEFLDALREVPVVSKACAAAGITQGNAYQWRWASERFAKEWDEAKREALGNVETVAYRIAIEDEDPAMLRWILSRQLPDEWGDHQKIDLNHSGEVSVRTLVDVMRELSEVGDAE